MEHFRVVRLVVGGVFWGWLGVGSKFGVGSVVRSNCYIILDLFVILESWLVNFVVLFATGPTFYLNSAILDFNLMYYSCAIRILPMIPWVMHYVGGATAFFAEFPHPLCLIRVHHVITNILSASPGSLRSFLVVCTPVMPYTFCWRFANAAPLSPDRRQSAYNFTLSFDHRTISFQMANWFTQ